MNGFPLSLSLLSSVLYHTFRDCALTKGVSMNQPNSVMQEKRDGINAETLNAFDQCLVIGLGRMQSIDLALCLPLFSLTTSPHVCWPEERRGQIEMCTT